MKKLLSKFFFLLLFFVSFNGFSQYYTFGVAATGIIAEDNGYAGHISYSHRVFNYFDYFDVGFQVNSTDLDFQGFEIPTTVYAFNLGYYWDVIRNNRRFFYNPALAITLGVGAQIGQEKFDFDAINLADDTALNVETEKMVYGPYVGVNVDLYINSFFAVAFRATETYHINSDIGELLPYVGLGVKFVIDTD